MIDECTSVFSGEFNQTTWPDTLVKSSTVNSCARIYAR